MLTAALRGVDAAGVPGSPGLAGVFEERGGGDGRKVAVLLLNQLAYTAVLPADFIPLDAELQTLEPFIPPLLAGVVRFAHWVLGRGNAEHVSCKILYRGPSFVRKRTPPRTTIRPWA